MGQTIAISEIVAQAAKIKDKQQKIDYLRANNSPALRTLLAIQYGPEKYQWNVPNDTIPPYTPSPHVDSHGLLYRYAMNTILYLIKGYNGDNLEQYRREAIFIQMLESIDKDDAKYMEQVLLQKPTKGITRELLIEAFGEFI